MPILLKIIMKNRDLDLLLFNATIVLLHALPKVDAELMILMILLQLQAALNVHLDW